MRALHRSNKSTYGFEMVSHNHSITNYDYEHDLLCEKKDLMTQMTYLPELDWDVYWKTVRARRWDNLPELLEKGVYERAGLDRLLTIVGDMQSHLGRDRDWEILDVGCNTGLFSVGLAALGNRVTGIDNMIVDQQGRYEPLRLPQTLKAIASTHEALTLRRADLFQWIERNRRQWDVILLLSVAHQWEFGYAHQPATAQRPKRIEKIMQRLVASCRRIVYYEAPIEEPGFETDYGRRFIERFVGDGVRLSEVARTVGSAGYPRQLFRIERR